MEQIQVMIPTSVKDAELVRKRRRQIVRAAMKLFAKKGFYKTSIRDIAKQSGISLGAIYNYVRNKEEILVLNQELFLEAAGARLKHAIQTARNPLEKLRRLIHTELHMMDQYADYLILVTTIRHSISEKYGNLIHQIDRKRIEIFDQVIQECIDTGKISPCNVPLTVQFIKVLVDSWVLKNWDIGERTDIVEMEEAILNLLWNGLLTGEQRLPNQTGHSLQLEGKSVFIVNDQTPLCQSIASYLKGKGADVKLAGELVGRNPETGPDHDRHAGPQPPVIQNHSPTELYRSSIREADIIVHDLGIGNTRLPDDNEQAAQAGQRLDGSLRLAQELATVIQEEMSARSGGCVIYLAPWQWDCFANPLRFEVVKEATIGLARYQTKTLAANECNVHCIVPGGIKSLGQAEIQEELVERLTADIPLGVLGSIGDIVNAVSFLCSDDSKYLTGQVLKVSGGLH